MSIISNPRAAIEPVVITRQFDDIDACAKAIQPLNVTANQLTPGLFIGKINFADFRGLKFIHVTHNQAVTFKSSKSPDEVRFSTLFKNNQTEVVAHGCPLKKHDLFGFDPTRESDVIAGQDTHIVIASLNFQVFQSLAADMGYDLGKKFLQQNLIRFHPGTLRSLKTYYQEITEIFHQKPEFFKESSISSLIGENFLPLLIDTLGNHTRKNHHIPKPFCRYSIVKKTEEIARSSLDKPLTLKQICQELATSSSALSYGFQEIFGISPMAYIKIQRLNGVRRTLKNADFQTTMVMRIAHQWGFWSAGHFSRDYQEMFGELPSETLRNYKN